MDKLIQEIKAQAASPELRNFVVTLLKKICDVDTTPYANVDIMRQAEAKVFEFLEAALKENDFTGAFCEHKEINPEIAKHPAFSLLHFTKTAENPEGLPAETVYKNRYNLLYHIPGKDGKENAGLALNAHIDVVKPYFPPTVTDDIIFGRGSCDDKGAVVVIMAALRILSASLKKCGLKLDRNVLGMFVVEEETGGNGSLSLAIDRELKKLYDTILVLECADNNIHPANRGAIWYKIALECKDANLFEMSAFIYEQLELEGRAIKAESRHALFPQRPVQTCHGILGNFGEHPSRICGEVAFDICFDGKITPRVQEVIEDDIASSLADYIGLYGDKTKAIDKTSGKPKVDHHYDLVRDGNNFICSVHGSTGHMGSIMENDGAITKMAMFVRTIFRSKARLAALGGGNCTMKLHGYDNASALILEGGQGFVPTHGIDEVMERITTAAQNGADNYARIAGLTSKPNVKVTYEKLHNAAFDGDPNSKQMNNALEAGRIAGIWNDTKPIMGWTVSCDSRLFAYEYPGMPVITSGAGQLQYAHGDQEQVRIADLLSSIVFTAVYIAKEAGITK